MKLLDRIFQRKQVLRPGMDYIFTDLQGHKYYKIIQVSDMTIERYGRITENIMWQSAGLTANELKSLIDIAKNELDNLVKGENGSLVKLGAALNEIEMRRELVMHTELLYHFLAFHYIRHDEDVETFNEALHEEKIKSFKQMASTGGAYNFFSLMPGLSNVIDLWNTGPEEWNRQFNASIAEQKRLQKVISYLKSKQESGQPAKTSAGNSMPFPTVPRQSTKH